MKGPRGGAGEQPLPSMASPPDLKEIATEGTEYSYSPDRVRAPAGKPLSITFTNAGGLDHVLTLFRVPGHREAGTEGTLTVG